MKKNALTHADMEQNLPFAVQKRKLVMAGKDIFVKEYALAPGQMVPWHHHSNVSDVFYCIQGDLVIERMDVVSGALRDPIRLHTGESARVDPGTAHQPRNDTNALCRFLVIQGVGEYDFIPLRKV